MKKTHLVIESILAVAIIFLFFLHFNTKKSNSKTCVAKSAISNNSIAYVNVDSVMRKYQMYNDLKAELESKKNTIEADLESKGRKLQNAVQDYQNKASKGLITRATAAEMEQGLQMEQQKLMQLQQTYQSQLAEEELVMQRKLMNSIMEFLNNYNKNKGYTYILGNSFGGNILYADSKFDISADVIIGLNMSYKK